VTWAKGQSGNPKGTPRGIREAAALAREHAPWCIKQLQHMAKHDKSAGIRIRAMELLLERGLGKAIQPVDNNASLTELLDAAERSDLLSAFEIDAGEARSNPAGDTAGTC
jgi:peptidyl-tRNA hydrolase